MIEKRVELHLHTKMSKNGGVGDVVEYIEKANEFGMPAIAITDFCIVESHKRAHIYTLDDNYEKKHNNRKPIKIIYGVEDCVVDDSDAWGAENTLDIEKLKNQKCFHVILLVKNDVGRVNLNKIISLSYDQYFFNKPRILRSILNQYREGILVGSAGSSGELTTAICNEINDEELLKIASYYDYLEIQPANNYSFLLKTKPLIYKNIEDLEKINKKIVELGEKLNKTVVATSDCYYVEKKDKICSDILKFHFNRKEKKHAKNDEILEKDITDLKDNTNCEELYFRSTEEMLNEFLYLGKEKAYEVVVKNTNLINNMIDDIFPLRYDKCHYVLDGADNELKDYCYNAFCKTKFSNSKEAKSRLESELKYIIENNYSSIFVVAKRIFDYSNKNGHSTLASGLIGSSFVGYLLGFTDANPLSQKILDSCGCTDIGHDIPCESIFGLLDDKKYHKKLDIDFCVPTEIQEKMIDYLYKILGEENVFKAGDITTISNETAYYGIVRNYINNVNNDISEGVQKELSKKITGVFNGFGELFSYFIIPKNEYIYSFTPVQKRALSVNSNLKKIYLTHIYYTLLWRVLPKIDIRSNEVVNLLKNLSDITGIKNEEIKYDDVELLSLFKSNKALGIKNETNNYEYGVLELAEVGIPTSIRMLSIVDIKTFEDLVCFISMFHGICTWNFNFNELLENNVCTISELPCYREHIMSKLTNNGVDKKKAFIIMENVSEGNGISDEDSVILREYGIPKYYIDSCKKIDYLYPKAKAVSQAINLLKMAWYKIHKPKEFYCLVIKEKYKDFAESVFNMTKDELEYMINNQKPSFSDVKRRQKWQLCRVVLEMYMRGIKISYEEIQ